MSAVLDSRASPCYDPHVANKGTNHPPSDTPAWARVLVWEMREMRREMAEDRKQAAADRKQAAEDRKQATADRKLMYAQIMDSNETLHDIKATLVRMTDLIAMVADRFERNTGVLQEIRSGQATLGKLLEGRKEMSKLVREIHRLAVARSNGGGNGRR